MNFKLSAANFEMLVEYVQKKAKGSDMTFSLSQNGIMEVKLTNLQNDIAVITLFQEQGAEGTSFPKIAVTRRLGDEIK